MSAESHPNREPKRIGVVGLGLMGWRHGTILAQKPDVELIGGVDLQPEVRQRFGTQFGCPTYQNIAELLAEGPDAVVIAVPDNGHVEPAVSALSAGCATLLEKPMATSVADARTIADAARSSGSFLMIGQTLRFDPRYRHARDVVRSGRLGDPTHCYARRNSAFGAALRYGSTTSLPWHVSVHDIDAMLWATGLRVREVTARASRRRLGDNGHWDALGALLVLSDGTPFLLESAWVLPTHLRSGIDSRLEIVGTRGSIEVHGLDEGVRIFDDSGTEFPDVLRYQQDSGAGPGGALRFEVDHFLAAAAGFVAPEVGVDEVIHGIDVVEALIESVHSGRTITVNSAQDR